MKSEGFGVPPEQLVLRGKSIYVLRRFRNIKKILPYRQVLAVFLSCLRYEGFEKLEILCEFRISEEKKASFLARSYYYLFFADVNDSVSWFLLLWFDFWQEKIKLFLNTSFC